MVLMQNQTSQGRRKFMMHVPQQLTDAQREVFTDLYPLLSSFQEATIVMPKSSYITDDDKITNVDIYYEMQGISKENGKRK